MPPPWAIKRQCKAVEAVVMRSRIYINEGTVKKPDWVRYQTPTALQREIVAIDRGGKFEPGHYHITAPCEANKLGADKWGFRTRTRNKPNHKPRFHHITTNIREVD